MRPALRLLAPATAALGFVSALSWPSEALAVRPFVTDDARIIDRGQLETENWLDLHRARRRWHQSFNVMAGVSFNEWAELIAGGGVALDGARQIGVINPVIQPKFLVMRAEDDGVPGISIATGVTLPVGIGPVYDNVWGMYLIAPITSRLFDDWLMVHVNLGARAAIYEDRSTSIDPYWGVGFDLGVGVQEARIVGEAFAGDPLEPLGPRVAAQGGFRWLKSDYVNFDLTFGGQPELDDFGNRTGRAEIWGQLGVRLLFDIFTRGGRPGDPMGARGMFVRRKYRDR
jgi:hypothetical protein